MAGPWAAFGALALRRPCMSPAPGCSAMRMKSSSSISTAGRVARSWGEKPRFSTPPRRSDPRAKTVFRVRLPLPWPNVTMLDSMAPIGPNRPRIGIPWRTSQEEAEGNLPKIRYYSEAVLAAGGEPVLLSLVQPDALKGQLLGLDGFVLPGSPADVDPAKYGAANHGNSTPADPPRELTDRAILDHAFAEKKPVLAICYGLLHGEGVVEDS